MKHYIYLFCSLIFLVNYTFAQRSEVGKKSWVEGSYEKGEIIIEYEYKGNRAIQAAKLPRGAEILREQDQLVQIISKSTHGEILGHRPAYKFLVDLMVKEGLTEPEAYGDQRSGPDNVLNTRTRPQKYYNFSRVLRVYVDVNTDLSQLIQTIYAKKSEIEYSGYYLKEISLNPVVEATSFNNDVFLSRQFAHQITGAPAAWMVERGEPGIIIGIIDTGIDFKHEDLKGKIVPGFDFVHRTQIEEWQKLPGEDYENEDDDPTDFEGHGTHVSGIAAAQGNNGIGISGVCPDCSIMPLRTISTFRHEETVDGVKDTLISSRGNVSESAEAVIWATDRGAKVINMSFAGNNAWPQTFRNALVYARDKEVTLISSAANDTTAERRYPAAHNEVIAVASTDLNDRKSFFSNYGTWVDVSAPGEAILSTVPPESIYPPEGLVQFAVDGSELTALPMSFSGDTDLEGVNGSLAFIGLARASDVSNSSYDWDLEGKIALVERGEISFREKALRAIDFGADGVIVYNNEPGIFRGTLNSELEDPIPVFGITQEDGNSLRVQMTNNEISLAKMLQTTFPGYTRLSGTSFSSPYIAGVAGLILSQDPSLTPDEVTARIKASVDNIDALNPEYIGQLGTGRINLAKLFPQVATQVDNRIEDDSPLVYPNPFNNILFIRGLDQASKSTIRLHDMKGRKIQYQPVSQTSVTGVFQIDVSELAPGWYVISGLTEDNQVWTHKILKI